MRYFQTAKSLVNFLAYGDGGAWMVTSCNYPAPSIGQLWDPLTTQQIPFDWEPMALDGTKVAAALRADLLAVVQWGQLRLHRITARKREPFEVRQFDDSLVALSDSGTMAAVCLITRDREITDLALDVYWLPGAGLRAEFRTNIIIRDMAFSPDSRYLAWSGTGGFTLWDLVRGESISVDSYDAGGAVAMSPAGDGIATVDRDLVILRRPSGDRRLAFHPNQDHPVHDVCYSPDGRILATASGTLVQFWHATDAHLITSFDWEIGEVRSLAFAPDGLTIAAGGSDRRVVIWDLDA